MGKPMSLTLGRVEVIEVGAVLATGCDFCSLCDGSSSLANSLALLASSDIFDVVHTAGTRKSFSVNYADALSDMIGLCAKWQQFTVNHRR